MRTGIIALFVIVQISLTTPGFGQEQSPSPLSSALKFFDALASKDVDASLRAVRTVPISSQARELVRATLPAEGALTPTPDEIKKLDALKPLLIYHERDRVFDIKVIDLPQAYIGLHGRAILLISRPALKVVTAAELQALAAHELAHDFLWDEFERERGGRDRQQLELECDGIAALTLVALGLDPMHIVEGVKKVQRFNERFGVPLNVADYPTVRDREQLVTALVRRQLAMKDANGPVRGRSKAMSVGNWWALVDSNH